MLFMFDGTILPNAEEEIGMSSTITKAALLEIKELFPLIIMSLPSTVTPENLPG